MSEAKPTPGPWVFEEQWHGTAIKTEAKPGAETVARVSPRSDFAKEIANARLIAAAPELLEAAIKTEGVLYAALGEWLDDNNALPFNSLVRLMNDVHAAITKTERR